MAILNYTTTIDPGKTIGEISQCLAKNGVRKIVTDYDENGLPVGLTFWIEIKDGHRCFALPCNWEGVFIVLRDDKSVAPKLKTKEQALRISWRILKDWIFAQMAIIQAGLASTTEVFLPYLVTVDGKTLYQKIEAGEIKTLK